MDTPIAERRPPQAALPARIAAGRTPALFAETRQGAQRFWEFFGAHLRNANTRLAYVTAAYRFADWCAAQALPLGQVEPLQVARYIEQLGRAVAPATVKQHLAALRQLFDWLVVGQVLPSNPAAAVRGPKHVVNTGKTPVLTTAEARRLLASIDPSTCIGLRDRALIGLLVYRFARISAARSNSPRSLTTRGSLKPKNPPPAGRPRAAKSAKTLCGAIRRLGHTASAVASTKEVPVQEP